jgi:DNA-binding CsgD family transcriptional regulator
VEHGGSAPRRVAVIAADAGERRCLSAALRRVPGTDVVAWAEDAELLLVLGSRVDVAVFAAPPGNASAARLRERGMALAVVPPDADPAEVLARELLRGRPGSLRRPRLAPRQRDVLVAYVSGSELLPTVARELGMDPETVKTHLRRIRAKYAEVGRAAPTRRDLYVRAVEDGLVPPPAEGRAASGR